MAQITVIVPMYNPGKSIVRCIDSLAKQTYKDFKLIIINDGSTDNSITIVKKLIKKSDYLYNNTIIINRDNHGIAETRNYGIEIAETKYVSFMDQDDCISKDYLEVYYNSITKNDYDIVVGGYQRVSSEGRILSTRKTLNYEWPKYTMIMPWGHLYKRGFLIDNNIKFLDCNIGEDIYFNVIAYQLTDKIKVIDDVGYKWIYNNESVSNTIHKSFDSKIDQLFLFESLYNRLRDIESENDEYVKYFFLRSICHNFLYSTRHSHKELIENEYNKIFGWLKIKYPDYNSSYYVRTHRPKGESFFHHICVHVFYLADQKGLLLPILKMVGKKD